MAREIRRSFTASAFGLLLLTILSVPARAAADIGDFNGDGHQDLVWMGSSTLQVTVHYYNNSTYLSWNWLNKTGGTSGWVVVAAADFDGNGIPDLVWQNTSTQQVIIQYYGGTGGATNIGSYTLYTGPEPGWSVVAAADFDGNGVPDLVWQNATTGVVTVWYYGITNGVISNIGWNYLNKAGNPGWTIKAAADFDGNGVPDLVWQNNTTGIVTVSYYGGAGGATNLGTATLEPNNAPTGWVVAGANDFDGNGVPDLVWADTAAGQTVLHYFGGTGGSQYLGYASINGEVGWVPIVPHLGHSVTCSASPNPAIVGQLVTFSATPTSGTSTYAYTWSGTVGGTAQTATWLPGSAGNYTENISARDISGHTILGDCSVTVQAAPVMYTISGTITAAASAGSGPLSGATVTLSGSQGGSTTTNSSGAYSFTVGAGGNYTVTPSMPHQTFSPVSSTFNSLSSNQVANFVANDPIAALMSCLTSSNSSCIVPPGKYQVATPIVIARNNVVIEGAFNPITNPSNATVLIRAQGLKLSILEIGQDESGNPTTGSLSGITIQNLAFCGATTNQPSNGGGRYPDPQTPCPITTQQTTCEEYPLTQGPCQPELCITNTGPGQAWSQGAGAPFNNTGPYNVTISNCIIEDSPSGQPTFIAPKGLVSGIEQVVNDVYLNNNRISAGGGSGAQIGAYGTNVNWGDYTQCDNWQTVHGTNYADDTTITVPRNLRFTGNTFYGNSVSGFGRYVQLTGQNTITDINWPNKGGGGLIEQELCADQVMITGNTLTGVGNPVVGQAGTSGMELYSRNLTISGNYVSGFAFEAIGLLSVYNATATNNHVYDNDLANGGNPQIKIATRYPGSAACYPQHNKASFCDAYRDAQLVTVQNNDSVYQGVVQSAGDVEDGIFFDAWGDGSTDKIQVAAVSNNVLSVVAGGSEVGADPRATFNTSAVSPNPVQVPITGTSPQTIAVFPEGNPPLGVSKGTMCTAYNADPPYNCSMYSNRGTFQFGANDPSGLYSIHNIEVFLGTATSLPEEPPGVDGPNGPFLDAAFCHFFYYFATNTGGLFNTIYLDQNTVWTKGGQYVANLSPGSVIGSGAPLSNGVCTIYPATSGFVQYSSNDLTLNLDIQFLVNGTYYMYETALDQEEKSSSGNGYALPGWSLWGYWQVGQAQ